MTEIKKKKLFLKDIQKNYGINLKDNDCSFFEHQIIPLDHKFYNRIFTIQIQKLNKIKQNFKPSTSNPYYKGNIKIANNNNLNNQQQHYLMNNPNYNNIPNNNIIQNYNNGISSNSNPDYNNNTNNTYNNNNNFGY